MTDRPVSATSFDRSARPSSGPGGQSFELRAIETVGSVITDLVEVTERLPVRGDEAEATARILDRLSEEIKEAAAMLRGTQIESKAAKQ